MTTRIATAIALLCCTGEASAQSLRISVVDESGGGVLSRVYYEETSQPRPFWNTDTLGRVERPHNCGKTKMLKAAPMDSGSYFESPEEPCANKVTLRVLKRKTPIGVAFAVKTVSARLPDGSPAVVKFSTVLGTAQSTTLTGLEQCEVKFSAFVEQEVFKVDGEQWTQVRRLPTLLSSVISEKAPPDQLAYAFPGKCADSAEQVRALQLRVSNSIAESFRAADVVKPDALSNLGVRRTD